MPLQSKLKPPLELKLVCEKKVWNTIINAYSGDFFNKGDIPLLVNYVRLKTTADRLHKKYSRTGEIVNVEGEDVVSIHFKLFITTTNAMAGLAQKLRIAPSSRMRQESPTQSAKKSTTSQTWDPDADWESHKNK